MKTGRVIIFLVYWLHLNIAFAGICWGRPREEDASNSYIPNAQLLRNADRDELRERAQRIGTRGDRIPLRSTQYVKKWDRYKKIEQDTFTLRAANDLPENVFQNGLPPSGYKSSINDNLTEHHLGFVAGTQWVSTTPNRKVAMQFAKNYNYKWLYYIYLDKDYAVNLKKNIPDRFSEDELSSLGRIPGDAIIGVAPIEDLANYSANPHFNRDIANITLPDWFDYAFGDKSK